MFGNLKFRTQLFSGNGLILVLMIAISAVVYTSIHSLLDTFERVDHTHKVLAEASRIEASAVDMETGMRGYLLAGKESFLDPYNSGDKSFNIMLDKLSKTVDDNPAQVKLLAETRETINQWKQNVTEPTIELRRQIGDAKTMNDMAHLIQEAKGKQYFDKFREQVAIFIEREETLMEKRHAKARVATDINELRQLTEWVDHTHDVIATANLILASAVDMETGMRGFLLAGKDEFLAPYNAGKQKFYDLVASLSKTVADNPAQVALLGEVKVTIDHWLEKVVEGHISLRRSIGDAKNMDDMAHLVGEAKGKVYFDKFRDQIKTFKEREESLMGARMNALESTSATAINIALFGTLLAVCIGIAIVVLLTRSIMKQLGGEPAYIADIARSVAAGDLNIDLQSSGKDEGVFAEMKAMMANLSEKATLAQQIAGGDLSKEVTLASDRDVLGKALQGMVTNLNDVLGQIQVSGEQIASGSGQVSDSSQSLSQGATQQASSLEEISASLNQLASQTTGNAENANLANQLASEAQSAAQQGGKRMESMVTAMGEINEAGQNISKIIKTIDEIAFQTNLLALNAAVEAARAGQHGKGFAVVAEEVRNLAARSAKAAEETSELIEGSVAKTQNGSTIANQTAEALQEIFNGISKTSDLVAEIAAASSEQAQGVSQISEGIGQIDQVTQQNTANAEESAASAEELSGQAESMKNMLGRFVLKTQNSMAAVSWKAPEVSVENITAEWPAQKDEVKISLDDQNFGRF